MVEPVAVTGVVQHYDWGDSTFIPDLLGVPADGRPWAELWLGTHANGPTFTNDGTPLRDLTGDLPYLLKVLSANRPLSLQVHPTAEQAREGFARGVYPDDRAKPELLCALTAFDALCGLRPIDSTLTLLDAIGADELATALADQGIKGTIESLYRGRIDPAPTVAACAESDAPEARLVADLAQLHRRDPSVVVTLLLNRVSLRPGEALHLVAGTPHAYLAGAGVELMGSSDNVVRGGITTKRVDVDELLRILDPTPTAQPVMADTGRYPLPEVGCELIRIASGETRTSTGHELAVSLAGATLYLPRGATLTATATTFIATAHPSRAMSQPPT